MNQTHAQPDTHRRILFGTTSSLTARAFLRGQLGFLQSQGWAAQLVCGDGDGLTDFTKREGVVAHIISAGRNPSLGKDVKAFLCLFQLVRKLAPSVTIMGTPKMGLFGTAAAWLCRVPRRVYVVHGLRFEGAEGLMRRILKIVERLTCLLATEVVAVSPSVRDVLIGERICARTHALVLGSGSPNGFDETAFTPASIDFASSARQGLNLPLDVPVVGFVGRLTGDKGVGDLVQMWQRITLESPDAWLLVVGGEEPANKSDLDAIDWLSAAPHVRRMPPTKDIASIIAAIDLLVLPTRREGLPTVVLEAAAMTKPTVAYSVTGTIDVIRNGETGLLVPFGDKTALTAAVELLLKDGGLRRQMGTAAHSLVTERFPSRLVWQHWADFLEAA